MLKPEEVLNKRILISPLNWGWGHVARCIPLIAQLQGRGNRIYIACTKEQKTVFQEYLNEIEYLDHEGYPFRFGGKGHFVWDMLRVGRDLKKRLKTEELQVEKIIHEHRVDLVISDHRYGFRSSRVPSIFITHQVNLPLPFWLFTVQRKHRSLMQGFDTWWIMDFADHRLAGKLSASIDPKAVYIGPYSRFTLYAPQELKNTAAGRIIIGSGPKVYAEQFLAQNKLDEASGTGATGISKKWCELDQEILNAESLVTRSGYSTIMDLYFLRKGAELSPTPGQAEQIYLFELHGKNPSF